MIDSRDEIENAINSKEINWSHEWEGKYKQFVTTLPGKENLDLLLFTLPSNESVNSTDWPEDKILVPLSLMHIQATTGLAQLATKADENSINTGICYSHSFVAGNGELVDGKRENYGFINPHNAAMMALSSGAKSVGLSLQSSLDLIYAEEMVTEMRNISIENDRPLPRILVGGPQATLDKVGTQSRLKIEEENVIQGRGEVRLMKALGVDTNDDNEQGGTDFDPLFLQMPGDNHKLSAISLSFVSTGGLACIGKEPCSFCNAYNLGSRIEKPEQDTINQIKALSKIGIFAIQAADNFINLAKSEEADRFVRILKAAKETGVLTPKFLTRPDLLSRTDADILAEVRKYANQVFLGIESGNIDTLLAMKRVMGGKVQAESYLQSTLKACEMLKDQNFDIILSGMLAFPINATPEKCRKADSETLDRFRNLMNVGQSENNFISIQIDPVWMLAGSAIYKEMISRGATPESLEEYNLETRKDWVKIIDKVGGENSDLETVILEGNKQKLDQILDYLDGRRKKLDSLVVNKFLKAD